jgi:hypothetical protein
MIKIDFSFHSQYGTFADALHLEDDHGLTQDEINFMQQQRFDNWVAIITAPPSDDSSINNETPPNVGAPT